MIKLSVDSNGLTIANMAFEDVSIAARALAAVCNYEGAGDDVIEALEDRKPGGFVLIGQCIIFTEE